MTNDLTDARADLATVIRTALGEGSGTTVDTYVPEELDERHVVIQLPANSLRGSATYSGVAHYELTLDVCLLLSGLDNAGVHEAVDDFLARVFPAIHASSAWRVDDGSLSNILTFNTAQGSSPGIKFTASAVLTITPQE